MAVASYCYYEKVCRTMRTSFVSYLLRYFYSFSAAELNNLGNEDEEICFRNFHAKRIIMEIVMMKILNNCISGRLNSNYFHLNESSILYWQCFAYSITAWKNTYLKNYSKTFNGLILTPYSYPKQTTHWT